jgi:hypothetical protein
MSLFGNPAPVDPWAPRPGETHQDAHLRRVEEDPEYRADLMAMMGVDPDEDDGRGFIKSPSAQL